jgi:flagellar secretion chaperone FliS
MASTSSTRRSPATTRTRTAKEQVTPWEVIRNMRWKGASAVDLVVALYDGIHRFLYAANARGGARRPGRAAARGEARPGHHHSPAGAAAHGCGRPAGAGAQRVLRVHLRADLQASQSASRQKFEHAIDCVRTCAMPGGRWRGTPRSIPPAPPKGDRNQRGRRQAGFERRLRRESCGRITLECVKCSWNAVTRSHFQCSNLSSGDRQFFFELLLLVEAGVVAVARQQFVVPAQLHDPAVVEHGDLVGIAHGGNAVRDEDGGGGGV